jgi:hypothetical protein
MLTADKRQAKYAFILESALFWCQNRRKTFRKILFDFCLELIQIKGSSFLRADRGSDFRISDWSLQSGRSINAKTSLPAYIPTYKYS